MTREAHIILESWSAPIGVDLMLCLSAGIYVRGWFRLRAAMPELISAWRLAAFLCGLLSLWIAIGSPLEAFDEVSLSIHMVQHLLLMYVAPPLILLGAPSLPLLRGLPQWIVRDVVGPFLRWTPAKRVGHWLTQPAVCWLVAALALLGWHVPAAFELALRSNIWHYVEHVCFFSAAVLFWWPVVRPFPSEARWPGWSIPLYLFLGTLPSGALGAFLTFCDRVIYPWYGSAHLIFGVTPLGDQVFAGALMWVFGMVVYMVPASVIMVLLLLPVREKGRAIELRQAAAEAYEAAKAEAV